MKRSHNLAIKKSSLLKLHSLVIDQDREVIFIFPWKYHIFHSLFAHYMYFSLLFPRRQKSNHLPCARHLPMLNLFFRQQTLTEHLIHVIRKTRIQFDLKISLHLFSIPSQENTGYFCILICNSERLNIHWLSMLSICSHIISGLKTKPGFSEYPSICLSCGSTYINNTG